MAERPLPVFDPSGPAHDVSVRWSKWKRSFSYYAEAEGLSDSKRKMNKLLHLAGLAVQDIFDTLPEPAAPAEGSDALANFERAIYMLDKYFEYKPNTTFERHTFRRIAQREDETVSQFANRLRQQAQLCSFSDSDEQICDQLIEKVRDDRLRRKFLEKQGALKLQEALEMARQFESTKVSARGMSAADDSAVRQVSSHRKNSTENSAECRNCGNRGHNAGSSTCPARGKECRNCLRKGHFKRMCRSPAVSRQEKGKGGGAHQINEGDTGQSTATSTSRPKSEEFGIGQVNLPNSSSDALFVTVYVNSHLMRMEVDTGAKVSIVPESVWKSTWSTVSLQKSDLSLSTYNGSPLQVIGEAVVDIAYGEQTTKDRLIVVDGGSHALLGRNWLQRIRLDWSSMFSTVHSVSGMKADFPAEFPAVFADGLGTVKGYEAEIRLKGDAVPRCCAARTVPYAIRPGVDQELDRLEHEGIIRQVKSAEWASPLVIVHKKNGDIRICADFKVTINRHIDPRQHPIPDPNELLSRVAGGSLFTTLDLSQAYAQLPLSEESQKYCVIATRRGLYAYNRLPFGGCKRSSYMATDYGPNSGGNSRSCVLLR